jgi:hypothetical protein
MLTHRLRELLEDPVHPVLARPRLELLGINEQVDVL